MLIRLPVHVIAGGGQRESGLSVASNLLYVCRCEGTKADGTPCRKLLFTVHALNGTIELKCRECKTTNRLRFAHISGSQYINGSRADRYSE